jgi:hypothetical protein
LNSWPRPLPLVTSRRPSDCLSRSLSWICSADLLGDLHSGCARGGEREPAGRQAEHLSKEQEESGRRRGPSGTSRRGKRSQTGSQQEGEVNLSEEDQGVVAAESADQCSGQACLSDCLSTCRIILGSSNKADTFSEPSLS